MPDGPPDPELPSLELIRGELNREQESYERRAAQVDTKAGLLLAAAGVIVGFRATAPTFFGILSQLAAAIAGGLAVWAFWPRVAGTLSPRLLRDRYLVRPEDETKLVVLDTRLIIHADDEASLKTKATRLKSAFVVLALAALFAVLGSILNYANSGGRGDHPSRPSPKPSSSVSPGAHSHPARLPTGSRSDPQRGG